MINTVRVPITAIILFIFTGCDLFLKKEENGVVARVNDTFLYEEDLTSLISENTSPEDSAIIVSSYINRWATQRLLIDRAKVNLNEEQQKVFEELVRDYKNELYAKAYTDVIVARELDTVVNMQEARSYYDLNGENFILGENLLKLRYIYLSPSDNDFDEIRTRFRRFNQEDKRTLMEMAIQFGSFSLNDSIWVRSQQVFNRIESLSLEDQEEILKKENFLQVEDSLGVYLIFVEDVRLRNQQAPLQYSLPGVKQILLNRRKLELIKKLEKDITQDAIKNKKFEIYN